MFSLDFKGSVASGQKKKYFPGELSPRDVTRLHVAVRFSHRRQLRFDIREMRNSCQARLDFHARARGSSGNVWGLL